MMIMDILSATSVSNYWIIGRSRNLSLKNVVPNGDKATMGIGETKVLKIIDNAPEPHLQNKY
jgi:hypothetical protein